MEPGQCSGSSGEERSRQVLPSVHPAELRSRWSLAALSPRPIGAAASSWRGARASIIQEAVNALRLPEGRLGLGMAALGRPAYINLRHASDFPRERTVEAMRLQAHGVLDAAFAHGIRYVDAARSYGQAEAFVRAWLDARRLSPDQIAVGSKWGYVYEANWGIDAPVHERKVHSLWTLERQVGESTAILGPYLRLYQIHSATLESRV